jgi:hypothetical protein
MPPMPVEPPVAGFPPDPLDIPPAAGLEPPVEASPPPRPGLEPPVGAAAPLPGLEPPTAEAAPAPSKIMPSEPSAAEQATQDKTTRPPMHEARRPSRMLHVRPLPESSNIPVAVFLSDSTNRTQGRNPARAGAVPASDPCRQAQWDTLTSRIRHVFFCHLLSISNQRAPRHAGPTGNNRAKARHRQPISSSRPARCESAPLRGSSNPDKDWTSGGRPGNQACPGSARRLRAGRIAVAGRAPRARAAGRSRLRTHRPRQARCLLPAECRTTHPPNR